MDGARPASAQNRGPHQDGWLGPPSGYGARGASQLPPLGPGVMSGVALQPPSEGPKVGYILKMFPRLSETFILNEVRELERQDVLLHIFSLKRPADAVSH